MATPRDSLVKAERLKNLLVLRATGREADDEEYSALRRDLLAIPAIRAELPSFVESSRTLDEFWAYIKSKFGTYAERRSFLRERFDAILTRLETDAGILAPPPEESPATRNEEREYDIAVSYASEDLAVAEEIVAAMEAVRIRVFFDRFMQAKIWGKDLAGWFGEVYGGRSKYVLVLVSRHYAVKDWTDFEFTIARGEARTRREEFILPVRLDATPMPGLRSTVAYVTYRDVGAEGLARLMLEKLGIGF